MDLGLAGSVVVVWGAARGIGAAIARAFAAEAAHLAVIDRDPSVLALASQIPESLGLIADVTDFAAVRRAAGEVARRFSPCQHIVFAVGVGSGKFGFPFWKRRETLNIRGNKALRRSMVSIFPTKSGMVQNH